MSDNAKDTPNNNTNTSTPSPLAFSKEEPHVPSNQKQPDTAAEKVDTVRQYKILNKLTGALVFVGIVSLLVNYLMWNQAKRQADAADSAIVLTQHSVAIAESSITLSKKIAETQERFAKIDARAYIMLQEISASQIKCGDSLKINSVWVNAGHTPADEVGENHAVVLVPNSAVEKVYALAQTRQWPPIHNINPYGPGMTGSIFAGSKIIRRVDSAAIVNGEKVLLTYGTLTYTDIFGDGDTTRYCFRYNPHTKLFSDVTGKHQRH